MLARRAARVGTAPKDAPTGAARPPLSSLFFEHFQDAYGHALLFARSFASARFGELAEVARGRSSNVPGAASRLRAGFATVWSEWLAGLRVVRADRMLTSLFLILSVFSMADAVFSTLLVAFAKDIMHVGTAELGFVLASQGVGGLLGSVIVARLGARISPQRWIALACFGDGLLLLAIFNLPIFWVALALIFLAGILMVGLMVSVNTLLQTATTDAYRGRVFGVWQAIGGLMLLIGALLAGSLADLLGVLPILDAGALLWVFAGLLAAAFVPGVVMRAAETHTQPASPVPAYDQNV